MLSIYDIVNFKEMKNEILLLPVLLAMGFNLEELNLSFIINVFLHEILHILINHIGAANTTVERAINAILKFQS